MVGGEMVTVGTGLGVGRVLADRRADTCVLPEWK